MLLHQGAKFLNYKTKGTTRVNETLTYLAKVSEQHPSTCTAFDQRSSTQYLSEKQQRESPRSRHVAGRPLLDCGRLCALCLPIYIGA